LASTLAAKQRSVEEVPRIVGDVSLASIKDWVSEKSPVPFRYQQLLAAWLDAPRWELFTDVSPAERGADDVEAET
jgi:hypothetical protein